MGKVAITIGIALAALLGTGCGSDESSGGSRTLNWYVFAEPSGAVQEAADNCTKQSNGRYKVEIVDLPTNADQQRELVVRRLAAEDDDIDIIGMDVIWTAEFAEAEWIKQIAGSARARAEPSSTRRRSEPSSYIGTAGSSARAMRRTARSASASPASVRTTSERPPGLTIGKYTSALAGRSSASK